MRQLKSGAWIDDSPGAQISDFMLKNKLNELAYRRGLGSWVPKSPANAYVPKQVKKESNLTLLYSCM